MLRYASSNYVLLINVSRKVIVSLKHKTLYHFGNFGYIP